MNASPSAGFPAPRFRAARRVAAPGRFSLPRGRSGRHTMPAGVDCPGPGRPVLPAGRECPGRTRTPHPGSQSRVQGALGGHRLADNPPRQRNTIETPGRNQSSTGPPPGRAPPNASSSFDGRIDRMPMAWAIGLAALVSGCGAPIEAESGNEPIGEHVPATVSVSGRVTFDHVPPMPGGGTGLDYNATRIRPARGVTVEIVVEGRSAATAVTDDDGRYRLNAPLDAEAAVTVRAELGGDPDPLARVLDNTRGGARYTMTAAPFDTGDADVVRDLHAASGWTGTSYGEARTAAPFAILDVLYEAFGWVQSVDPDVRFVPLDVYWSPDNAGISGDDGEPHYGSGRIGGTHYRKTLPAQGRGPAIYLLGSENEDTDEYDRSVIAHEWMHYFLDTLSRDDSMGGRHALGELLDLRLAYSEGMATALAAAMTGETEVRYTLGPGQTYGGRFSVEAYRPAHPGWFSEGSVMAIAHDLLDPANDDEVEFGFETLYEVLVNEVRETPALTSVFALIDALKRRHPQQAGKIDALTARYGIGPVADAYGRGEANAGDPPSADTLPVYAELTVNGQPVNVCSTAQFRGARSRGNALGVWRFLKVRPPDGTGLTLTATPTSAPPGERPDPRVGFYSKGPVGEARSNPGTACAPDRLAGCSVRIAVPHASAGREAVVAIAEATNASRDEAIRPIGRTCFDVRVSAP